MKAESSYRVFPVKFLRLPSDASHVRGDDYGCSPPASAGNLFRRNNLNLRPFRLDGGVLYHRIGPADEESRDSRPQVHPGSLCRTLLVSVLIYGRGPKI